MSLDAVALVRRYHAALDAYDAAVVGPMFAADAVYLSPGVNGRIEGREAIIAAFSAYFAEHPDQRAADDSIEQTGPREALAVWRLRATAASTGAPVTRQGIETVGFDAGGLIVRVEVEDR
jgi:uncharacterized protein (TIGR02246 family)